jgi:hypothetical protein
MFSYQGLTRSNRRGTDPRRESWGSRLVEGLREPACASNLLGTDRINDRRQIPRARRSQ